MTPFKLFAAFIICITFSLPATAKLYKWVDDNGTTHYGETIPPEYADKNRSTLNKAGRVINQKKILTSEERSEKEQADAKKREEQEAALEQKRRDKALVSTYSNVKEIELARSRNLQQVEARISSVKSRLKMAEDNLARLNKEAAGYKASGKKAPDSLEEDLKESQRRMNKLQTDMANAKEEKAVLDARYDADKARYKELTGK